MIELSEQSDVFVLRIGSNENRFSYDWLTAFDKALDEVVAAGRPLVTIGDGKFYSNGLDLDWVMANPEKLPAYSNDVQQVLARVLTLPVPTVAAVSGHAFGAGAMLAMAHDYRVMRADRGFFCFPEVDIRIPFTTGMAALIQAKVTPNVAVASMTTGRRFGGEDAASLGLVDATASEAELLDAAVAKVADLNGKDVTTLAAIKSTMFATAAARLRDSGPAAAH